MSGIELENREDSTEGGGGRGGDESGGLPGTDVHLNRKQATIAVAPFVAIGLGDVVLLLFWGLDPLWGFVILPPILFVSVIGWIAFRSGFVNQGEANPTDPTADSTGGPGVESEADHEETA